MKNNKLIWILGIVLVVILMNNMKKEASAHTTLVKCNLDRDDYILNHPSIEVGECFESTSSVQECARSWYYYEHPEIDNPSFCSCPNVGTDHKFVYFYGVDYEGDDLIVDCNIFCEECGTGEREPREECTPDCSSASSFCVGEEFPDGCGGVCYGTRVCGNCNTNADTNCDGCVSDAEFPTAIINWKSQQISDSEFPTIVINWKQQTGC